MNDFIDYLKKQEDDSPLYLFDHCFGEYPSTRALLEHYTVPPDLLERLGPLRPPYRWLLIGPRRSGSTLHKDPLGTSAWNALISGRKLWVLFPPGTPAEKLRPEISAEADSAAAWFLLWWRRKREEWPKEFEAIEFIQEPGEIVFVPARWWHAVLNLEEFCWDRDWVAKLNDSIAVTQNFCNEWNAAAVWRCAKATHPILARQLRSIFDSQGIQVDADPMAGDEPSQFDLPSEPPEPEKTEDPRDSSDDEYLTWLSVKRQKWLCIASQEGPYSGHLVNNGVAWGITDTILKWDGLGQPPPELPLRPPGPPEPKPEEQQRRKKFAEQAEEQGKEKMSLYGSSSLDKVKSRADILATLGFDDQHIYGVDGLATRQTLLPWVCGAMDETVLVTLARVAERAERYDEMADFMKQRVQVGSALNPEERDMFSAAFKNSLTERRHAVRVAAGVEQMELCEGREAYASLAGGYRSKMEAELQEICSNALNLLSTLVNAAEPGEAKTFFLKMQGDYYRYLAEWTTGPAKSEVAGQAMEVYKSGMGEAMSLPTAHPVRLGLALNFSVFLHEVLKDTEHAVATATDALNAASAGIEDIPEESRNDSIITMQLLNDNLMLWRMGHHVVIGQFARVNQGDRLRLHQQILLPAGDRTHGIEALMMKEGDSHKLKPVEKRCRALWNVMIAPLLMLAHLNRLENRQPDLLKYLLHCLLGPRGMVFGVLASVSPTKRNATLPAWEEVAKALESGSLSERLENLRVLGFRGPKPRKTCWAGSVWVKDEYPRNPDSAPWKAFEYVDREDAEVLGQGKPGMKNEAFRWNRLWCLESNLQVDTKEREWEMGFKKRAEQFIWEESPGFKWDGGAGKLPTPNIHDKIQLTNRLFVDEALAQCVPMTSRLKLVGEKLLCPLLVFSAESLKKTSVGAWLTGNDPEEVDAAEKLAMHRDMLRYVASQVACGGAEEKVWQKPFLKVWEETKEKVAVALHAQQSEDLVWLTQSAEEVRWQANESQGIRRSAFEPKDAPQDQAELLPEDEIRWFKRRRNPHRPWESGARVGMQAYVQLRLCGAIGCAKDFLAMAASISRTQPRNFAPAFWMGSYGLLLWGRARQLRPSLEIALRKRLIRAKFPVEEEEEESEEEDDDEDFSDVEDEGPEEEEEKPVPQFAIYGPHLVPLAEVLRLDWSKGPAGAPSQRVSVGPGEEPLPAGPVNMLRTEIVCKNVESLLAAYEVLTEDAEEEDIPAKSKEVINLEEVSATREDEDEEEEEVDSPTNVEEIEPEEDEEDFFLPEDEASVPSELSLFSRAELHVQRRAPLGLPAKLRLVKVFNGFHPDNANKIFPQAAGILLLMHVSARKSQTAHKGHGEKATGELRKSGDWMGGLALKWMEREPKKHSLKMMLCCEWFANGFTMLGLL
eukprot:s2793_g2.t1